MTAAKNCNYIYMYIFMINQVEYDKHKVVYKNYK